MGDKVGQIHMKKQNLDKMGGRKISALRTNMTGGNSSVTNKTTGEVLTAATVTDKMIEESSRAKRTRVK